MKTYARISRRRRVRSRIRKTSARPFFSSVESSSTTAVAERFSSVLNVTLLGWGADAGEGRMPEHRTSLSAHRTSEDPDTYMGRSAPGGGRPGGPDGPASGGRPPPAGPGATGYRARDVARKKQPPISDEDREVVG